MDAKTNAVRDLLRQKSLTRPEDNILSNAIRTFDNLVHTDDHATLAVALLAELEAQGLWGTSEEERELRKAINAELHSSSNSGRFTIVTRPPPTPSLPWVTDSGHALIVDPALAAQLNEVAFLHVLATAPAKVIPPGKSLRAALASPEATRALGSGFADDKTSSDPNGAGNAPPTLQAKVEEIAQRAFWDEALESLADPARQLARLKRLYSDLHTALQAGALLPPSHPSMITLSAPLSPTPAPLRSARRHLAELTAALRTRCAPVRDAVLDAILSNLTRSSRSPSPSAYSSEAGSDAETTASYSASSSLPARIVAAFKDLLHIAEVMSADLSSAALSTVSDDELAAEIVGAAREGERRATSALYGFQEIIERWRAWVDGTDSIFLADADAGGSGSGADARWMQRLVQALGSDIAVSCPLPDPSPPPPSTSSEGRVGDEAAEGPQAGSNTNNSDATASNALPPPFLFSMIELLHLQNRLQALVIAAVLRTLVPLRPRSSLSSNVETQSSSRGQAIGNADGITADPDERTFVDRVLALLMLEVDESAPDAGSTKLVHLADEVVREHRRLAHQSSASSPLPESETSTAPRTLDEQALRRSVDAFLSPTKNSVFVFLRLRLLRTLADALTVALHSHSRSQGEQRRVPDTMHTGRERKRLRPDPQAGSGMYLRMPGDMQSQTARRGALRRAVDAPEGPAQEVLKRLKGYEDPALRQGVNEALGAIADVIDWVRETWTKVVHLDMPDSSSG